MGGVGKEKGDKIRMEVGICYPGFCRKQVVAPKEKSITTASICSSVSTETCLWVNLESRFTMPKPPVQKRDKCSLNKLFTVVTNV